MHRLSQIYSKRKYQSISKYKKSDVIKNGWNDFEPILLKCRLKERKQNTLDVTSPEKLTYRG